MGQFLNEQQHQQQKNQVGLVGAELKPLANVKISCSRRQNFSILEFDYFACMLLP